MNNPTKESVTVDNKPKLWTCCKINIKTHFTDCLHKTFTPTPDEVFYTTLLG